MRKVKKMFSIILILFIKLIIFISPAKFSYKIKISTSLFFSKNSKIPSL